MATTIDVYTRGRCHCFDDISFIVYQNIVYKMLNLDTLNKQ